MSTLRPTRKTLAIAAMIATLGTYLALPLPAGPPTVPAKSPPSAKLANGCTLSGPFTHENLSVFLVHGADRLVGKKYLTLQEALEQKKVVVHETGKVNELVVENNGDVDVFIQAGDIVRGGRQDRTLGSDLVLGVKSGKVPIASFCVEQGRWTRRAGEEVTAFNSSANCLSSNSQKLAVRYAASQQEVWDKVAAQQAELETNVGAGVRAPASPSSLELTLNDDDLRKAKEPYAASLAKLIDGKSDVVGVVFAVNGEVTCADIYAGPALLRQLWPKLIDSAMVEAVALRQRTTPTRTASADDVRALLAETDRAAAKPGTATTPRTKLITRNAVTAVAFETHDKEVPAAPIHHNCLRKSPDASPSDLPQPDVLNQNRTDANAPTRQQELQPQPQQQINPPNERNPERE